MASLFDRVRSLFAAPADLRLAAALATAPEPAAAAGPFEPGQQQRPRIPPSAWMTDQPPPPAATQTFVAGYHDRTFQSFSAPQAFDFDIERIRAACSMHRQGMFLESSALAVAVLGFAPVLACLQQALSPFLALNRHIRGGQRGLARIVAAEIEEQLAPRGGLMPSVYFPPTLYGTIAFYLIFLGFAVLQHVDGEPDPETGVRPRYTRLWPPWAVVYYRYRRTFVAMTTDGPVDILNDGHFTLVADTDEPHFEAAILALGEEVLGSRLTQQARNSWINRYGNPKWVGTMPEKVATMSPEGQLFYQSLATIIGPDGYGVLPYGSKFETVGLNGEASGSFKESLDSGIIHVAMAILGSDGTIRAGGEGGAGPYRAPGFWAVRHDLNMRRLMCVVRGINQGHVAPYLDFNYAEGIAQAKARGNVDGSPWWVAPVLEIPLPDPDADARMASIAERTKLRHEIILAERQAGLVVTQERVDRLSAALDLDPIALGELPIEQWEVDAKLVAPDEVRTRRGLPALPNGAGSLSRLAEERLAGKDETGASSVGGASEADASSDEESAAAYAERQRALYELVVAEKAAGGAVDRVRVESLAARLGADAFALADTGKAKGQIFAYHIDKKVAAADEARDQLGLDPLPYGAGSVERLAQERLAGKDETGAAPAPADDVPASDEPSGATPDESTDSA